MRIVAKILLLFLPLISTAQVETVDSPRYRVESAVWCSGEFRGDPELLLNPGLPGVFEIHSPDSSWRFSVEVEPPAVSEGAAPDSLWIKVGIEQEIDGQWEFLTDTMLGTPIGTPGIITVVEDGAPESGPKNAPLYVEMTVERVQPGA